MAEIFLKEYELQKLPNNHKLKVGFEGTPHFATFHKFAGRILLQFTAIQNHKPLIFIGDGAKFELKVKDPIPESIYL